MKKLIDFFAPRELLHIVSIANRLKILSTEEKKYLLAVRMGSKRDENKEWDLEEGEKEKFYPLFSRFMNLFPKDYECVRDECPVCSRLLSLKQDFTGKGKSEEYSMLMSWVSRGQNHYTGGNSVAHESFSSEDLPGDAKQEESKQPSRSARVKRIRVVARKPKLDRSEPKEAKIPDEHPHHPFIESVRELAEMETDNLDREDLLEYCRRSRELFARLIALWDQFDKTGKEYRNRHSFSWITETRQEIQTDPQRG